MDKFKIYNHGCWNQSCKNHNNNIWTIVWSSLLLKCFLRRVSINWANEWKFTCHVSELTIRFIPNGKLDSTWTRSNGPNQMVIESWFKQFYSVYFNQNGFFLAFLISWLQFFVLRTLPFEWIQNDYLEQKSAFSHIQLTLFLANRCSSIPVKISSSAEKFCSSFNISKTLLWI